MSNLRVMLWTAAVALALSACGGGGGSDSSSPPPSANPNPNPGVPASTARGTLITTSLAQSLSASDFTLGLNSNPHGQVLLGVTGPLTCAVSIHHIEYWTVSPTPPSSTTTPARVSGAIMIPTGAAPPCSGPRPILLYARGHNPSPTYNMANIVPTTLDVRDKELVAAIFAAQGYIVVAPNRVGYDISTLGYEAFLNADQNSKDMMDALAAAKTALSGTLSSATTPNDKLFVAGYSEGGFVAMATARALQAAGVTVTATAPMAGIYAPIAYGDAAFLGGPAGSFLAATMTTSYQNAYGNVYTSLADIYSAPYTSYITSVLQTPNRLPAALFNGSPPFTGNPQLDALLQPPSDPFFARAFGAPYLVTNSYRQSYLADVIAHPDGATTPIIAGVPVATAPQNTLRQDLKLNDMRNWTPRVPMLLCGGHQDHNVQFVQTETMAEYWSVEVTKDLVTVLDIDTTPAAGDAYAVMKSGFQQWVSQSLSLNGSLTTLTNYHGVAAYFCLQSAYQYFGRL